MSPAQCRAARALLNLEQADVAKAAGIARNTVNEFENEVRTPRASTVAAIRVALETAGVVFLDQNGNGPGVALSRPENRGGTHPDGTGRDGAGRDGDT